MDMEDNDTCKGCFEEVESDGYGELVHSRNLMYGCAPGNKRATTYPVAS